MNRHKLKAIFDAGFEAVFKLFKSQAETAKKQLSEIARLEKRIKALEDRFGQNSSNSSKPPSSDWPTKLRSLRSKSGKSPGGQKGHKGHNLKMVDNPDNTIVYKVYNCSNCGSCLDNTIPDDCRKRQVFDLPPIKVNVTEHIAEKKTCPHCGHLNKASFPDGITQLTQYGPRIKSILTYLSQYQLLPYERTSELFSDLFNIELSAGTIVNTNRVCFEALKSAEDKIKQQITASSVVHFDETGMYTEEDRWWLHAASTDNLTYYSAHPRRGKAATDEISILPNFYGVAVHDGWNTYFKYSCGHALCNAHHLRELKAVKECYDQKWAIDMTDLLLKIKEAVDTKRITAGSLEQDKIEAFKKRYDKIIKAGIAENPPAKVEEGPKKRGRTGKSKAENLLFRLKERWKETLYFMYDFDVPFDNSQSERDIRMVKVQQKISGTFRSINGAKTFCRIRGYISTARKNSLSVIDAIQSAFEGNPFTPVSAEY